MLSIVVVMSSLIFGLLESFFFKNGYLIEFCLNFLLFLIVFHKITIHSFHFFLQRFNSGKNIEGLDIQIFGRVIQID